MPYLCLTSGVGQASTQLGCASPVVSCWSRHWIRLLKIYELKQMMNVSTYAVDVVVIYATC